MICQLFRDAIPQALADDPTTMDTLFKIVETDAEDLFQGEVFEPLPCS